MPRVVAGDTGPLVHLLWLATMTRPPKGGHNACGWQAGPKPIRGGGRGERGWVAAPVTPTPAFQVSGQLVGAAPAAPAAPGKDKHLYPIVRASVPCARCHTVPRRSVSAERASPPLTRAASHARTHAHD